jgi:hypothetical protein
MIPLAKAVNYLPIASDSDLLEKEATQPYKEDDHEGSFNLRLYCIVTLVVSNILLFAFSIRNLVVSAGQDCANKEDSMRDMLKRTSLYCKIFLSYGNIALVLTTRQHRFSTKLI